MDVSKEAASSPSGATISIFRTSSEYPSRAKPVTCAVQPVRDDGLTAVVPSASSVKDEDAPMSVSQRAKASCPSSSRPSSSQKYQSRPVLNPSSYPLPQASWLRNWPPSPSLTSKSIALSPMPVRLIEAQLRLERR